MPNPKDLFPLFQEALRGDPDAAAELPHATRYRYLKGELPKMFKWFIDHPDYLRRLAEDAEGLTDEKRAEFDALVDARAGEQKEWREKNAPAKAKRKKK